MRIDIHVHLAGIGDNGSGCFVAPRKFNSLLYRLLRWELGLNSAYRQKRFDEAYFQRIETDLEAAVAHDALDALVLFPHEQVYRDDGELHSKQEIFVPNAYVFDCCRKTRLKGRMLPAVSVHPYRRDAIAETERWLAAGAVAMKWLPNSQNIDPQDPRCVPIYKLLQKRGVPLIAHTGGEHTVRVLKRQFGSPQRLRVALDHGVTVVMAHAATKSGLLDPNWFKQFRALARDPLCWGDISALCTPGRLRWARRLVKDVELLPKLIHGSDYPVPPSAWLAAWRLGLKRARELQRIESFLERDVALKRALGFPEFVFTNAARVLPPGAAAWP